MQKLFIYITRDDDNWLSGFRYFIEEWQLNYKLVQFESVEALLLQAEKIKNNIHTIILDWELPETGYFKTEAFEKLEKAFPFIPIIAFSEFEFSTFGLNSLYINKKLNEPEAILNKIINAINFYGNEWINTKINRIIYYVEIFTSKEDLKNNIQEISFYDPDPLVSRKKAIKYFQDSPNPFLIKLHGFDTDPEFENIIPYKDSGGMVIYSDFLYEREILANLNAEYKLYIQNGFNTLGSEQDIILPGMLIPFKVLKGISTEYGKLLLR